jgi:4-hydroxybenzoate polyprenyltransferase
MNPVHAYLRLARISNLPTVWTNVLAASTLSGGATEPGLCLVMLAASLLYTGGMFLNDAFDQSIDTVERPGRPLPSGIVPSAVVWVAGFAMLGIGVLILGSMSWQAAVVGVFLAAAILVYNAWHKGNSFAPFIMGLCRALVYIATAAAIVSELSWPLVAAAGALLLYVAGLTFAAKEETFDTLQSWWPLALLAAPLVCALLSGSAQFPVPLFFLAAAAAIATAFFFLKRRAAGDVGRAVSLLIAAIALCDALAAATTGDTTMAFACCALFALTLLLQRVIPGT